MKVELIYYGTGRGGTWKKLEVSRISPRSLAYATLCVVGYQSALAAMTKYRTLGGLNDRDLCAYRFGGWGDTDRGPSGRGENSLPG